MNESGIRPSPGLNLDHGFLRKIEQNQHLRHRQHKEDALRRQEAERQAKRVTHNAKLAKPTMEIYRPPAHSSCVPLLVAGMRMTADFSPFKQMGSNGIYGDCLPSPADPTGKTAAGTGKVHFQLQPSTSVSSLSSSRNHAGSVSPLKSSLKRSKSFAAADATWDDQFDRTNFPVEYQGLLKRALNEPKALTSRQIMEVVRVVCSRAVDSIQQAEQSAHMCFTIIQKSEGDTFLESLLNSCREWYNERDKLLRAPLTSTGGLGGVSRRWTAYVSFLAELFMRLKSRHQHLLQASASADAGSPAADRTLTLVMLLYECCQLILKPPSIGSPAEIECLRSVLTTVGQHLEQVSPQQMEQLVCHMRDAFVSPSTAPQIRKTLLELIELRANQWQLDLPQSSYYFPYTSLDRK